MLENNFDFKLNERLWLFDDDSERIYHAELVNDDYVITWDDSGKNSSYPSRLVESYIEYGDWLLLKESFIKR